MVGRPDETDAIGAPDLGGALSLVRIDMITPSQSTSTAPSFRVSSSAPYSGPERRVADRRRSTTSAGSALGPDVLGPYLPDRTRVVQQHFARVDDALIIVAQQSEVAVVPSSDPVAEWPAEDARNAHATWAQDATAAPSHLLPWITTFLDDEVADGPSAAPVSHPVAADALVHGSLGDAESDEEALADVAARAAREAGGIISRADDAEWMLDHAASELQRMGLALSAATRPTADGSDATRMGRNELAEPATGAAPLAMWSDDDFVDVMPVHAYARAGGQGGSPDSQAPAADVIYAGSTNVQAGESDASAALASEAAAQALEAVALRVRSGALSLNGFNAALGEAAALASTLAALLSAHR